MHLWCHCRTMSFHFFKYNFTSCYMEDMLSSVTGHRSQITHLLLILVYIIHYIKPYLFSQILTLHFFFKFKPKFLYIIKYIKKKFLLFPLIISHIKPVKTLIQNDNNKKKKKGKIKKLNSCIVWPWLPRLPYQKRPFRCPLYSRYGRYLCIYYDHDNDYRNII